MQVVILAAGKGTRLHPVTETHSKAMAPVARNPMIGRVMDMFTTQEITNFIIIVSPDDQEIRHYFAQQKPANGTIQLIEQSERLGMAKALGLAADFIRGDFILSACDNFVPASHLHDLLTTFRNAKLHQPNGCATLSLMEIDRAKVSSTGIVELRDGAIWRIVEEPKPEAAPSNISSLPHLCLFTKDSRLFAIGSTFHAWEYELQDAIQMLIAAEGPISGTFLHAELAAINKYARSVAFNLHYLRNDADAFLQRPTNIAADMELFMPVCMDENDIQIGKNCMIGPNVYIEQGARIGEGSIIRDTVVLRNVVVDAHSHLEQAIVT